MKHKQANPHTKWGASLNRQHLGMQMKHCMLCVFLFVATGYAWGFNSRSRGGAVDREASSRVGVVDSETSNIDKKTVPSVKDFKELSSVQDRVNLVCEAYKEMQVRSKETVEELLDNVIDLSSATSEFWGEILAYGERDFDPNTNYRDYNNELQLLKDGILKKIPTSCVLDTTLKFIKILAEKDHCIDYFKNLITRFKGKPEYSKIVDTLPDNICERWLRVVIENTTDSSLVDKMYDRKWENMTNIVFEDLYLRLSAEKTKKFVLRAKARAQAVSRIMPVVGWFYPGMPYMDYRLLRRDSGFKWSGSNIMDEDTMWIDKDAEKNGSRENDHVIVSTIFGQQEIMTFMECSDAAAFDQVIHQFVLKESGTVSQYTYGNQYGMSYGEVSESAKFTYKNTKQNFFATYWVSDGDIRIGALDDKKAIAAVRDIVLNVTEDDYSEGDEEGGFFSFVMFIGGIIGVLYFFRDRVDAFVVTHPKYEKAWVVTCKAGNVAKDYMAKAVVFAKEKVQEIKNKKAK